jgi:hypothetical protein
MSVKKSIYLSDDNLARLEKVAVTYSLYDKDHKPDILGAMRYIIEHFESAKNTNKTDYVDAKIDHILKMVEQINVTIPQLYYNARLSASYANSALKSSSKVTDDDIKKFIKSTIDDTVNTCGQIQNNKYESLYYSTDKNNMKTIPIEEDKNQWK